MGQVGRYYAKESGEWVKAVFMAVLFILLIGVILAVLALALVVMMVGGMIWLIGIGVEAMSKGERGKGLTGAGRSTSDFPGKLWQQARGKKPKATATATYVPPPAPPAPKLPPPPKQYEVKCPTCATPLIATAGAGVGCPKCGTKMSVTPA